MQRLTIKSIFEGKTGFFDYINDDSQMYCIDTYSNGKKVSSFNTSNEDEYYNKLKQIKETSV